MECPKIVNIPKVHGSKNDSWLLVCVKEVQVHFLLAEYRYDLDLEFRWLNQPPKDMVKKLKMYEKLKRRSESIHHAEETFRSTDD